MSTDPVLIEDDDVDMGPVVILDEDDDKVNSDETKAISTVETIDLDDDALTATTNTNSVDVIPTDQTKIFLNQSELCFINSLKNNKLMEKIVTCCLNMPNALGMTRVINKTVIPLYRDANVHYKQSGIFRKLLKNTLRSLIKDPDHKFLHVKTLCEELKSGGLRRKVPFVTLATNLNNYGVHANGREIESSSRGIPQTHQCLDISNDRNAEKNNKCAKYISERKRRKKGAHAKKKKAEISRKVHKAHSMETRRYLKMLKEKTDVINLDNSDNESVINLDNDDIRNCTTITEENESANKGDDSHKNNFREETQVTDYSNEINVSENTQKTGISNRGDVLDKAQEEIVDPNKTSVTVTETEDCNKENKKLTNENHSNQDESLDYDLLIPQNHVEVVMKETALSLSKVDFGKVVEIEHMIDAYQQLIAELEETEVTSENELASPYVYCANLKKQVVMLYKKLCKINGYSEDIVKRREIRLHVVKGHPSGPAKRLEHFLNSTIDSTGTVAFPDFADVVKCVIEANIEDELGWDTQKVFQEASGLFHHCGQALRKRRQKREYRDLLSIVNNKELTDDPAERDPSLQAKLEENKRIAKVKEDNILERYVNMERGNVIDGVNNVNNIVQFETSQDSTDSDSDSEPNVPISNGITAAINQQCVLGESSNTNVRNKDLDVRLSNNINSTSVNNIGTTSINNIMTTTINNGIGATINPSCEIGESSSNNIIGNSNNLIWKPVNSYVVIPPIVNYQNNLGGSSNDDISYFYVLSTNNTIANAQSKPEQFLSNNAASNNNLYLTITPSSVANIQTTGNTEITSENNVIIENPEPGVPNGPCVSSPQNSTTCSTSNDIQQDAGPSSIEPDCEVKLEVKKEPIDVQGMLDELGDNFVCTVFDVEDPFLVIEISSDEYSDDEK